MGQGEGEYCFIPGSLSHSCKWIQLILTSVTAATTYIRADVGRWGRANSTSWCQISLTFLIIKVLFWISYSWTTQDIHIFLHSEPAQALAFSSGLSSTPLQFNQPGFQDLDLGLGLLLWISVFGYHYPCNCVVLQHTWIKTARVQSKTGVSRI